jgi:hypothetical protein
MADKAQKEIFDSYFHDVKMAYHKPTKSNMTFADDMELLQEKLHPFKTTSTFTQVANDATASLPAALYLIDIILLNNIEVEELTKQEVVYTENNPLTKATKTRPVYVRENATFTNNVSDKIITLYPTPTEATTYSISYYAKPTTPKWGYVVVKGRALYNSSNTYTTHFQLHECEEEMLVSRILQLTGVIIEKPGIMEVGTVEKASIKQEQND